MPRRKIPEPPPPKRRPPGTGSVGTRKDGRPFAILPSDLDPKRRPIYRPPDRRLRFVSEAEAGAWLDNEIARLRAPASSDYATPAEPLGRYLARWYDDREEGWPDRTRRAYSLSLTRWQAIQSVPLGRVTREVVQRGVAALQHATYQRTKKDGTPTGPPKPYSARTIQQARTLLHQALDQLVPDILPSNPARQPRGGSRTEKPEQPVWSAEQARRFLEAAERHEPGYALAFRLILRRALRIGEASDLKHDDVDESARVLRIDETAGMRLGLSGPTKTRRTRYVPLSTDLMTRLRAHRRRYPSTSPHVFTFDGHRVSTSTLRNAWHRVIRVARLPSITPKDGRATCATILLDEGWPLPEVARLLGHSSVATTASFYARSVRRTTEEIAELGERMDALLDGISGPKTDRDAVNDATLSASDS